MADRAFRRTIEEMYAAHCVLWNLGFSPDELFVSTPNVMNGDPPGRYATLTLRRGELVFRYNLAPRLEETECDRFLSAWGAFAERLSACPRGSCRERARSRGHPGTCRRCRFRLR